MTGDDRDWTEDAPSAPLMRAIFGARCPRCGAGKLFKGFLTFRPACPTCNLDFTKIDTGDGPAVFVILIAGFVIVAAALVVEVVFAPPYWVHLALWLPLTLIVSIGLLRPIKAGLAVMQYRHKAAVGRQIDPL